MNGDIADRWADALESGAYAQTSAQLVHDTPEGTSYCCLGVLCELAAKEGIVVRIYPRISVQVPGYVSTKIRPDYGYASTSDLPDAVVKWAGMSTSTGYVDDDPLVQEPGFSVARSLIDLNDDLKYDFNRIAAVIRQRKDDL